MTTIATATDKTIRVTFLLPNPSIVRLIYDSNCLLYTALINQYEEGTAHVSISILFSLPHNYNISTRRCSRADYCREFLKCPETFIKRLQNYRYFNCLTAVYDSDRPIVDSNLLYRLSGCLASEPLKSYYVKRKL